MKIGELAEKVGLSVSRVRYYENLGIIRSSRTDSGYREFPKGSEKLLSLVLQAKELGFTLKEIHSLSKALSQGVLTKDKLRQELIKKLKLLDQKVNQIRRFQKNVKKVMKTACPFDSAIR